MNSRARNNKSILRWIAAIERTMEDRCFAIFQLICTCVMRTGNPEWGLPPLCPEYVRIREYPHGRR